jgi:hypothetical protein
MTNELLQKAKSLHKRLHKLTTAHYAFADLLNESLTPTRSKKANLAGMLDNLPDDVFEELLPEIGKVIQPVIEAKMQTAQKEFAELK